MFVQSPRLLNIIVDLGAGVEPRGDLSIWMANVEIVVVPKCIIHCKNNAFGSDWQKHAKKCSETYVFFCRKLFWQCWRLHGSAMTLTNHRACAQHESVSGPRERRSHAYSSQICVFGIRHRSHRSHGSRGSRGRRRSGVKTGSSDPTSHTRRGPG